FFLNAPATSDIYTLSLHDALPISIMVEVLDNRIVRQRLVVEQGFVKWRELALAVVDVEDVGLDGVLLLEELLLGVIGARQPGIRARKSTRLNSSHRTISYAVFCLK